MDDDGLRLLGEFVEFCHFADEEYDFPFCFYCGADVDDGDSHTAECLRSRARAYLRDHGVEVTSPEDDE